MFRFAYERMNINATNLKEKKIKQIKPVPILWSANEYG